MPQQLTMTLEEYHAQAKKTPQRGRKGPGREQIIQNQILTYLEMLPYVYAVRQNSGRIKTEQGRLIALAPAGTSDICGYISLQTRIGKVAIVLAIEVKAGDNKPTELQQAYLDGVAQAGGCAFVARSVEDVERGIAAFVEKVRAL
jgi:hypothetical protein